MIFGYEGTAFLVDIMKDKINAQFKYVGGEHLESSFSFNLPNGNHLLKEIRVIKNKASNILISVGSTLSIESVYVK